MYPYYFFHNLTFWLRWHVDGVLRQAYGYLVLAWSYLRVRISMETKRPALAGLVQAKLYNHDLQNPSPLNLLETTLMLVF